MTTRLYYDENGQPCERWQAIDSKGFVKSGYTVSVPSRFADQAPTGPLIHDDKAHDEYVERMRKTKTTKEDASPERTDDAHDGYVQRMKRDDEAPAAAHDGYLARLSRTDKES